MKVAIPSMDKKVTSFNDMKPGQIGRIISPSGYSGHIVAKFGTMDTPCVVDFTNARNFWTSHLEQNTMQVEIFESGTKINIETEI